MYAVNHPRATQFVYLASEQSGSALYGASLHKLGLLNFRPVFLGAPCSLVP